MDEPEVERFELDPESQELDVETRELEPNPRDVELKSDDVQLTPTELELKKRELELEKHELEEEKHELERIAIEERPEPREARSPGRIGPILTDPLRSMFSRRRWSRPRRRAEGNGYEEEEEQLYRPA